MPRFIKKSSVRWDYIARGLIRPAPTTAQLRYLGFHIAADAIEADMRKRTYA